MKIFTQYPEYFSVFRSCNVGKKKNIWCGACAKCLFVAILLSAFLPNATIKEIFRKDILADKSLEPLLKQLTGETPMLHFNRRLLIILGFDHDILPITTSPIQPHFAYWPGCASRWIFNITANQSGNSEREEHRHQSNWPTGLV
jgi:hypothetical protein